MSESLEIESPTYLPRQKTPFRCFGRLGNCFCLFITSNGQPWIVIGPDWPFCLCLLAIMLGVGLVFVLLMAPLVPPSIQIIGALVVTSAIGNYLATALKNPGIELGQGFDPESPNSLKNCAICGAYRAEATYHCEDCDVCIRDYDHHCPVTGKCIGEGNILFFYAFLISVFMSFCYVVLWVMFLPK